MPDGRAYLSRGAAATDRERARVPGRGTGGSDNYVQLAEPRITAPGTEAELTVEDPDAKDGGRLRLAALSPTRPVVEDGTARLLGR